ncbi:MAG: signal peptidase II [Acidobacteriota bacterium]
MSAIGLGCFVTFLDLLTKWYIRDTEWLHNYTVIEGFFRIHYVRNEGIAFGLFHGSQSQWKPVILTILAIVALIVVIYYIWTTPLGEKVMTLCLGLLLGGILGNFIERLMRQHVTDFIEVHWREVYSWPTFNVADSAITCGVLFILYQTFFGQPEGTLQGTEKAVTNQ